MLTAPDDIVDVISPHCSSIPGTSEPDNFQTLNVLSLDPVTNKSPVKLKAPHPTYLSCPSKTRMQSKLLPSQSLVVLSPEVEAKHLEFEAHLTDIMEHP